MSEMEVAPGDEPEIDPNQVFHNLPQYMQDSIMLLPESEREAATLVAHEERKETLSQIKIINQMNDEMRGEFCGLTSSDNMPKPLPKFK